MDAQPGNRADIRQNSIDDLGRADIVRRLEDFAKACPQGSHLMKIGLSCEPTWAAPFAVAMSIEERGHVGFGGQHVRVCDRIASVHKVDCNLYRSIAVM